MNIQMILSLAVFLLMIIGYVVGPQFGIPNGITGMAVVVLVAWLNLAPLETILSHFATSNNMLIIGMFIIAAGFSRTQAIKKVSATVYKISGGNFTKVLAGYVVMGFILTNLGMTPMATFALIGPLAAACCSEFNMSPSKMIMPIALATIGSFSSLPVGSGAIVFAQQNAYLESYEYTTYQMELLDVFFSRFPLAVVILLYAIFIMPKFCPAVPSTIPTLEVSKKTKGNKDQQPLTPLQEFLGYGVFVVNTVLLVINSTVYEITDSWLLAFTGATILVVFGVLKPKEAINAIPVRVILMLAAASSIGTAMTLSGVGELIGDLLADSLGNTTNGYLIGAAFFVIPFILTQFMNNVSVGNIFRPILILTCKSLGCNPIGPLLLLLSGYMTAFMSPMATGTIPIAMDLGGYTQKDLIKMGWLPSIIIAVFAVFWIMTIYPAFP